MKTSKHAFLAVIAAAFTCLTFTNGAQASTIDPGAFAYRSSFTVSGYAGSAPLTNFPVLVRLAANSPEGFSYADCAAGGSDIRFADADGKLIPHEVDTWNTSGESLVWVSLPIVTNGTSFTMCYCAVEVSALPEVTAADVWTNANFNAVWHFSGDATESANGLTVSDSAGTPAYTATTFGVGKAFQTDGNASIGYDVDAKWKTLGAGNTLTISTWAKFDSGTPGYARMLSCMSSWDKPAGWELTIQTDVDMITVGSSGKSQYQYTASGVGPGSGNAYLTVVYNADKTAKLYINGILAKSQALNQVVTPTEKLWIASCNKTGNWWNGKLDEIRIHRDAESADWVKACYDTMSSGAFLTAGPSSASVNPQLSVSSLLVDLDAFNVSATIDALGGDATSCDLYFAYAPAGDALPDWTLVASGLGNGASRTRNLTGLVEDADYDYAFMASNNLGRTIVRSGTFMTGIGFKRPDKNVAEFSRGVKFTVTGYTGTQELTNFPVLVRLSNNSPSGFSYADFYNPGDVSGSDLCFLDAAGNGIPHEIDTWNPNGESLVWVTLPRMVNGTEFSMWYRSSKNGSVVCADNAWEDYTGVWHLGEGGDGVQSVYDSTTNDLTGVTHANSLAVAAGRIGAARRNSTKSGNSAANGRILVDLSDSAKRAAVDALAAEDSDKTFTASLWMCPRSGTDYSYMISRKEDDYYSSWGVQYNNNNTQYFTKMRVYSSETHYNQCKEFDVESTAKDTWRKIDIVWSGPTYTVYYNGGAKTYSGTLYNSQGAANGSSDLSFGGCTAAGYGSFNGELDEIRLRKGANSADWVKAEYDAVVNATFLNGGEVVALAETPRPIATLSLADSGAKYVQFHGSIGNCGGDASACEFYAKVWKTADAEPDSWTNLVSGIAQGSAFFAEVTGLDPETAYSYKLKAVNNLETPIDSEIAEGTFMTGGTGTGGTGGERYRVGNDYVHVFEIEQGSDVTTFEFTPPDYVSSIRALVVAGGGPGGYRRGGGGGAGGLIYDAALAVTGGETYTINVGTGGVASASASAYGSNGGDSSIVGTGVSVTATGGGAGGNYATKTTGVAGGSGGGGGGAGTSYTAGGAGVDGRGNSGGNSGFSNSNYVAGGGGGAGRVGGSGANDAPPSGGSGGQGFLTDISGTPTWYAGGGGGGGMQGGTASNLSSPGGGGDGGGGRGGMAVPNGTVNPSFGPAAVAGQNGLGGGGGGGSDVSGFYEGGNGGSGVVIVRYTVQGSGAGSAEPVVSLTGAAYAGDLKITGTYRVAWAGEGANDADVYIKWGYAANSLTHSVLVAPDAIGTGSFEITVPVDQTTIYLRAMADNGTAQGLSDEIVPIYIPEYSGDVPGDPTIPVFGTAFVSAVDGVFARLSGTVTSFGTAGYGEDPITGCVVYALVGTSDNVSRMAVQDAMPVTAGEQFSLAISNLTVATTYYWCLEARNSAGVAVATQVGSFTTLPEHTVANTVTANNVQRTVSLSGSLAQVGAGTTTVSVRWKEGSGEWDEWTTIGTFDGSSASTAFNTSHTSESWNTTISWQVSFSNQCVTAEGEPAGEPWVTTQNGTFGTGDTATYTWQAVDGDWNGSWTNVAHWACNQADRHDYPNGAGVTVVFNNNTVATIEVPGDYTFGNWSIAKSGCDVTLVGGGAATSALRGNMAGGAVANSSWTFSALTFVESNGLNFGDTSVANSTITFTDGAVGSTGSGYINLVGSNVWLIVEKGASFLRTVSNGTKDGGIRLDDGTISGAAFRTDFNWTATTNEWVIIKGASSRLTATESFRNESDAEAYLQNADTTFLFSVPRNGWAEAPLYAEYSSTEKFGGMMGDGEGGYVIAIDPESPAFTAAGTHTAQLVEWRSGIDTNHVWFATQQPENTTLSWTYGWPSTLAEPENEGDAPTGVKATIVGRGKLTMILVW